MFAQGRIGSKSREIYDAISEDLSRLEKQTSRGRDVNVVLTTKELVVKGFWAKVYEECVLGLNYSIKEPFEGQILSLAEGNIPLHTFPGFHNRALQESSLIADIVARALVTRFNANGSNNIQSHTLNTNTVYTAKSQIHERKSPLTVIVRNSYGQLELPPYPNQ